MTRLDKCELLKSKGYTYDPETGKIFGVYGKEIISQNTKGYIQIKRVSLCGHHFAWYMTYGNVDFNVLDHINKNKKDNRISNLRIVTNQQNTFNTNAKGYSYQKDAKRKWRSEIMVDGKSIYLGRFYTEEEAREAYLEAKKKYHII
jgi:hypothetical protein